MKIFVAGAGAWGTALAMLLEENGHAVTLWTRNAEKAREIDVTRHDGCSIYEIYGNLRVLIAFGMQDDSLLY